MDLSRLEAQFIENANAENAFYMAKYMKNRFPFYGIKQDARRALAKAWIKQYPYLRFDEATETALQMWEMPQREWHYSAIEVLMATRKQWDESLLETAEHLITHHSWWDSVDYISSDLVGAYFLTHPESMNEIAEKWLHSGNMWLQRTAIIFQRKYRTKTDMSLLFANCAFCMDSNEFFIQKAIGWALREYAKTNPDVVIAFAETHPLKPLSKREALRRLL